MAIANASTAAAWANDVPVQLVQREYGEVSSCRLARMRLDEFVEPLACSFGAVRPLAVWPGIATLNKCLANEKVSDWPVQECEQIELAREA